MKKLLILLAGIAYGQMNTPLTVYQNSGTATAEIRLQERRINGTNYFGWKAAQNLPTDVMLEGPADYGVLGQCLITDGAGVTYWDACGSVGSWLLGGNTLGANKKFGAIDNYTIQFIQDNVIRMTLDNTQFNTVGAGAVGWITNVQKLTVQDLTGGVGSYEVTAGGSMVGNSYFKIRDNAGSQVLVANRAVLGTPINDLWIFSNAIPSKRAIANGDAVNDTNFPNLGSSTTRWYTAYIGDLNGEIEGAGRYNWLDKYGDWEAGNNAIILRSARGLKSSPSAMQAGDPLAVIAANGWGTTGFGGNPGNIAFYANENFTDSAKGTYIWFATTENGSTSRTGRWRIAHDGMFLPEADNTYAVGSTGNRVSTVYGVNGDFFKSGVSGQYVRTGLLEVYDQAGAAAHYKFTVDANATTSMLTISDNAPTPLIKFVRKEFSVAQDYAYVYVDLFPDTTLGQSLGSSGKRWNNLYVNAIDTTGNVTVGGTGILEAPIIKMGNTMSPFANGAGQIGEVSLRYGTGYFVDLNISGTCTGCGGLPVVDTTAIVKGSVDATKLLRFEVDGFTSGVTRVLTPQNADYTIAGINLAQTFTATQTYAASIAANTTDTYDIGSSTRFRNIYGQAVNAEKLEIANSSFVTDFWRHQLGGSSTYSLSSGSGGQVEWQIVTVGSTNTQWGIRGTIFPLSVGGSNGDIGYSSTPWRTLYLSTSAFMNGTQFMDSSRNLSNIGTGAFGGAITANGGIATGSATNSTIYIGSGNLYTRAFSGADASCGSVTDGWIGIRTDTNEIQVCIGGSVKKVSLL